MMSSSVTLSSFSRILIPTAFREITLKEALDFVVKEANYSRFPVYEEDIDNIIGILHMRDMLHYTDSKEHLNTPIKKIKGLLICTILSGNDIWLFLIILVQNISDDLL